MPALVLKRQWTDDLGRETIQKIVKTCSPYANGLYSYQLELVSLILDGNDALFISATGDGKSCAFSVPILVLNEYNRHPDLYPSGLKTVNFPFGIVITPTKGLANNIVSLITDIQYYD